MMNGRGVIRRCGYEPKQRTLIVPFVLSESADKAIGTEAPNFLLMEPKTGVKVGLKDYCEGASATLVM
jgi:hypothetical protein